NGYENRRERLPGRGQRAIAGAQGFEIHVFGEQLAGGFVQQRAIILLEEAIGPEHPRQRRHDRHQQADGDHQPQRPLQPQVARRRNRPGGRRHEGVGSVQAGGQRHAHGDNRDFHPRRQGVFQRVENDVARIAEHRDRYQVTNDRQRQGREAFAQQPDDAFGHGDRRAGAFKYHPDDGTQRDNDPDVAKNPTEARRYRLEDFTDRHLIGET